MKKSIDDYKDIINLERPVSSRPKMSMIDRAAQFSPFAALTGFDAIIDETARYTEYQPEITEDKKQEIDYCLKIISNSDPLPKIYVSYFEKDKYKSGGSIISKEAQVIKYNGKDVITTEDNKEIDINTILELNII